MRNADRQHMRYKPPALRQVNRDNLASQKGSVANLHCDDTLRRVAVVFHRHILVCERRRQSAARSARDDDGASNATTKMRRFDSRASSEWDGSECDIGRSPGDSQSPAPSSLAMEDDDDDDDDNDDDDDAPMSPSYEDPSLQLSEDRYLKSQWKYAFIQLPRLPLWTPYRMDRVVRTPEVPTVERIYSFIRHLFVEAELSSECSVVCLVYVERLMMRAEVELLAVNWRPILMAGMLLASKVWQDLSSWNIEFARVYPQFSVRSINLLERNVLRMLEWDLFISGAAYAKYYFALRSLNESKNFRRRYNYIMRVNAPNSKALEKRSAAASNSLYSRSM